MNLLKRAVVRVLNASLPARFKNSFVHLSFHLAPSEFARFSHSYCIAPSMMHGLEIMAARGFAPRTVIDVGAYEGGWSIIAKKIWPACNLTMIEPNRAKHSKLGEVALNLDGDLFDDLLGARNGEEVRFNVMGTGSSVMSERSPIDRVVEVRKLTALDSLPINFEPPSFIKIDAQGYELEILKGAVEAIKSFEAILLEIAIIVINEGAPILHDVFAYMKALGFVTCDILELHRRPLDNALSQVDILFVREESALLTDRSYSTC